MLKRKQLSLLIVLVAATSWGSARYAEGQPGFPTTPPSPAQTGPPRFERAPPRPRYETASLSSYEQTSRTTSSTGVSMTGNLFEPATIVGRVGNQTILAGDVEPLVRQNLEPHRDKMSTAQYEEQSQQLMVQALKSVIETKLLFLDFLRELPDEKRKEALASIQGRVNEAFYSEKLPELLEKSNMSSAAEYDAFLRRFGSSLEKERRAFLERMMGQEMVRRNVEFKPYVTHQAMLDYYREHLENYQVLAKARWQRLTVSFDKFPSKDEAYRAIAEMGNAVLRNAPFSEVARRSSQSLDAQKGGFHDWTEQGSLRSKPLDEALFTLPLNRLSHIIEDEEAFYIVQVLEREDAGRVPFVEAQVEIKEKIRKERVANQIKEYVKRLREQTPVETIFDEPEDKTDSLQARQPGAGARR